VCQGNELGGGTLTIYSQELKLPQHTSCHRELLPYADLMNWLKIVDNASFVKLRTVIYDITDSMSSVFFDIIAWVQKYCVDCK